MGRLWVRCAGGVEGGVPLYTGLAADSFLLMTTVSGSLLGDAFFASDVDDAVAVETGLVVEFSSENGLLESNDAVSESSNSSKGFAEGGFSNGLPWLPAGRVAAFDLRSWAHFALTEAEERRTNINKHDEMNL